MQQAGTPTTRHAHQGRTSNTQLMPDALQAEFWFSFAADGQPTDSAAPCPVPVLHESAGPGSNR